MLHFLLDLHIQVYAPALLDDPQDLARPASWSQAWVTPRFSSLRLPHTGWARWVFFRGHRVGTAVLLASKPGKA